MHLHQGLGMVGASIRDPLPELPNAKRMLGEANAAATLRCRQR